MEACPTNAILCVDRNKLEQMSAEKRRRAAFDATSSLIF
jgi:electron transport protein HydN